MARLKLSEHISWQQIVFLALGGLRGSLSLVLAQTIATLTKSSDADTIKEVCWGRHALLTLAPAVGGLLGSMPAQLACCPHGHSLDR